MTRADADRWGRFEEVDRSALIRIALTVRCPFCGRQAGVPCWNAGEGRAVWPHPARLAAAANE